MSKVLQNAYEEVRKSKFTFDANNIEVLNAYIFWTNFSGKENQFGNRTRNFNLAVPEEAVEDLLRIGYRVRKDQVGEYTDNHGEVQPVYVYFINVKVNMESAWPPVVKLFTEYKGNKKQKLLDIDTIGELDRIDIKTCDCKIHSYTSPKFPDKCTGYLNTLYVIQEPTVIFNGRYDDWDSLEEDESDVLTPPNDDRY